MTAESSEPVRVRTNEAEVIMPDKKGNPATLEQTISGPVREHEKLDLGEQSAMATAREHEMGVLESIKLYPYAIGWSVFFGWALVMTGYDSGIIFSLFAQPSFEKKYGKYFGEDLGYQVSAGWQTALTLGGAVGQLIGALGASWPMERWGRIPVFAANIVATTAIIFMQMFATNIKVLTASEYLAGIPYGFYLVIASTYASEVCPVALRGILQAAINLAYVIGQFIAAGVGRGVSTRLDQWAYRIPFSVQWAWIPIFAVGVFFVPESPYWLLRQGRLDDARKSLRRLTVESPKINIDDTLALMEETTLHEMEVEKSTSILECFRGTNLLRTEIAAGAQIVQIITGIQFIGYATVFFEDSGLNVADSFDMGVGNTGIGFIATCLAWPAMSYMGRRTIFTWGVVGMGVCLLIIGILDVIPNYDEKPGLGWAQGALLDIVTFLYQFTIGPLTFVIFGEVGATRLRSQTVTVTTSAGFLLGIVLTVGTPYMLNETAGNWRGKSGFFWGGLCALSVIWCYFRIPETKGRTYNELDYMFENKVPIRDFKNYKFDTIDGVSV
ncbi:Maltose transport MAL31 [Hyphodiscus hymeniophilus]|uniref:Maltose transport MAL31 n=1 Tax=Hyphodiscus hymeniophilus TaxID=353542 RepID=A0A9P7AXW3_9HELO|nr:Maltose transport MAL31 [Hyphodiscus hymeniophilus]